MPSEIPFIKPTFPDAALVAEDFAQIIETNWYTNFGPREQEFARELGDYLGPDLHVTTYANGTLALIAAVSVTMGPGDREHYLLMPSFTFAAVAEAALWTGYRPHFIDIDPKTWQPSIASAHSVLKYKRDQVAGILLANAFGVGNPSIDAWEALAAEWDLPIVIDSAAGFGSKYSDGELVGGRANCEIFSFHVTKPFALGEGGALASHDFGLVERARQFQNFGFNESRECTHLGMNGKMQEINAAIGLRQLFGFERRLMTRRNVYECYRGAFGPIGVEFQPNAEISSLCFASIACSTPEQKNAIMGALRSRAIQARDYYNPPLHLQPFFTANLEQVGKTDLRMTEDLCSRIISLPVHDDMANESVERVIAAVLEGGAR